MSGFEIKQGEKIHCRELNSGKNHTGFFFIDENNISADIFGYDEDIHIDPTQPIYLRTEINAIVSLHSNIAGSSGNRFRNAEPEMIVHHQQIISNIAVIGPDPWRESELLKLVTFSVKHTKELLHHEEKSKELSKYGSAEQYDLFSVRVDGVTFRVRYFPHYSVDFDHPIEIWPHLEIEFDEGVTLFRYLDHVSCIVQLLSASVGALLKPSNIEICRLPFDEMLLAMENREFSGNHFVKYVWPESEVNHRDLRVGYSFLLAWNDSELSALEACVSAWVKRFPEWQKANVLMMKSLSLVGEISPERLLAACKWFEEIPTAKSTSAITEAHVEQIAHSASNKAVELGYGDIKHRVFGSLKQINTETHRERFTRLVCSVGNKFGHAVLDDAIIENLKRTITFRGKVAHGHFNFDTDAKFRLFAKSIYAMEALCFLLTIRDLPISDEGIVRAGDHPFVRNYRKSF